MKYFNIFLGALLLLLMPLSLSAATFQGGKDTFTVPQNERISDDLYAVAGSLTMSGQVTGDVMLAGGTVTVTGRVSQDVTVAGGDVDVLGTVGDDVRVAAGNVVIGSTIASDLVAIGGSVRVIPDTVVNGDVIIAGGAVFFDGTARGDLQIFADEVFINGTVQNVEIEATKIVIGDDATINGTLTYSSPQEAEINEGATITGAINFEERARDVNTTEALAAVFGVMTLAKMVILLVTALVFVLFIKKVSQKITAHALAAPGKDMLWGFVAFFIIPIAAIALLVTVVGSLFGVLVGITYISLLILASVFSGIIFGVYLQKLTVKQDELKWQWTVIGVVLLEMISLVPIIGWIIKALFFLLALGAATKLSLKRFEEQR